MSMKLDGTRIRALRLGRSWSQELLAEQAGVSLRTIQRMETEGVASLQTRRAVAGALGIEADELSIRTEQPEPVPARPAPASRIRLDRTTAAVTIASWSLLMLVLIGGAWLLLSRQDIEPVQNMPEPAAGPRVATVGYGDIEAAIAASGTLQPAEIVPVQARASGEVVEIYVRQGDQVQAGEVLALIDPEIQQLQVESARLELQQLQNWIPERAMNLRNSEAELMRLDERIRVGIAAEQEMDQARRALLDARASLESLQLDIQRSETSLVRAEVLLSHTEIRAPITGAIVSIDVREGAILNTHDAAPVVMQMIDLSRLAVEAFVPESEIARLDGQLEAWFTTLGSGNRRWPATLRRIEPLAPRGRSISEYSVILDVDNASRELYPNMTVQVFFVTAQAQDVLLVPVSALTFPDRDDNTDQAQVTVVLADGSTETRAITIGVTDRINAEVRSGLAAGERVIAVAGAR